MKEQIRELNESKIYTIFYSHFPKWAEWIELRYKGTTLHSEIDTYTTLKNKFDELSRNEFSDLINQGDI